MEKDIKRELQTKLTVSLWPTAAKALGLGRDTVYAAAERGEIPGAFRIGKKFKVSTPPLRRLLQIEEASDA